MNTIDNSPPNIVLVVWDACRLDYARKHASNLTELATENVWFENAIAPSPWSLPSHASIFTGKYPHEHGSHRLDDSIDNDLVDRLSEEGYRTYGVSANGFASQRTGFHEEFDEFYYTGGRELYPEGLDISGFAQRRLEKDESVDIRLLAATLRQIAGHGNPLKSAANLFSVAIGELSDTYDQLQRIPHPIFSPDSGYCYSPERNTRRLQSIVEDHDCNESPFFVFTNYMDTHRPYKPRPELQEKHLGVTLSFRELKRLNEHVAYPWEFVRGLQNESIDEEDIETIRGLYAGEVETIDEHLAQIRELLDAKDILEETVIVVTSDHGENLGEVDERGRRRMGHEASVSDAVLRVPLLLANPNFDGRTVTEPVSLKDLFALFVDGTEELVSSGGHKVRGLLPFKGVTASQYPATGGQKFFDRHPEVDPETIRHRIEHHSVVAYDERWKVIVESTGERWAGTEGDEQHFEAAPNLLIETAEEYLAALKSSDEGGRLADADVSQLEALGYL